MTSGIAAQGTQGMTKSGASACRSSAAERNVGTPHSAVISAPRSAERETTPAGRKRSGAARAMRRKNADRQPLPIRPKLGGLEDTA